MHIRNQGIWRHELVVAHLWVKDSKEEWVAMTLPGDVMALIKDGGYPASISQDAMAMQDHISILSCQHPVERTGSLVGGSFQKKK